MVVDRRPELLEGWPVGVFNKSVRLDDSTRRGQTEPEFVKGRVVLRRPQGRRGVHGSGINESRTSHCSTVDRAGRQGCSYPSCVREKVAPERPDVRIDTFRVVRFTGFVAFRMVIEVSRWVRAVVP